MSRDFSAFLGCDVSQDLRSRVKAAAREQDRTAASWMRQAYRERMDRQADFDPEEVGVDEAEKAAA